MYRSWRCWCLHSYSSWQCKYKIYWSYGKSEKNLNCKWVLTEGKKLGTQANYLPNYQFLASYFLLLVFYFTPAGNSRQNKASLLLETPQNYVTPLRNFKT